MGGLEFSKPLDLLCLQERIQLYLYKDRESGKKVDVCKQIHCQTGFMPDALTTELSPLSFPMLSKHRPPTFISSPVEEIEEPGLLHKGPGFEDTCEPESLVCCAAARVQEHAPQETPHLVLQTYVSTWYIKQLITISHLNNGEDYLMGKNSNILCGVF